MFGDGSILPQEWSVIKHVSSVNRIQLFLELAIMEMCLLQLKGRSRVAQVGCNSI